MLWFEVRRKSAFQTRQTNIDTLCAHWGLSLPLSDGCLRLVDFDDVRAFDWVTRTALSDTKGAEHRQLESLQFGPGNPRQFVRRDIHGQSQLEWLCLVSYSPMTPDLNAAWR